MKKIIARVKEIFAPDFLYCVTLNCECGVVVMVVTLYAKSPEHATTKVIDKLLMQGIVVTKSVSLEVEQI